MKRSSQPVLTDSGEAAVARYTRYLHDEQDASAGTRRSYLSELRKYAAWCEASWSEGHDTPVAFTPPQITTPLVTQYRSYLQTVRRMQPTTINRILVGLKRYCAWATEAGLLDRDPARVVKLIPQVKGAPRHLSDGEEQALLAAVTKHGPLRDQTIFMVLLHTGLRAHELCGLEVRDVTVNKRSGVLRVRGKRNKYREVPLNSTAREALTAYRATVAKDSPALFCSQKTSGALTERALGYLIAKYAALAKVADVSLHDLRYRFGYRMAAMVPLHRLAQMMGHDSLDTTMISVQGTKQDVQQEVEKIAWAYVAGGCGAA